jgi:hypothetical protein
MTFVTVSVTGRSLPRANFYNRVAVNLRIEHNPTIDPLTREGILAYGCLA